MPFLKTTNKLKIVVEVIKAQKVRELYVKLVPHHTDIK